MYYPATVTAIEPVAIDHTAVAVSMRLPERVRPAFEFSAGQYVTVRTTVGGEEITRLYSVCSTPVALRRDGILRIGVRVLPDGVFSRYASTELAVGDDVELTPPLGRFTTAFHPGRRRRYAAVAAGSGITPVLSLVASALATEPESTFTVLLANRTANSAMFTEELAELKDQYLERLHLVHVLSREQQNIGLAGNRLDRETLPTILTTLTRATTVHEWFLCGPYDMVLDTHAFLTEHDIASGVIHVELFRTPSTSLPPAKPSEDIPRDDLCSLTVELEGRATTAPVPRTQPILESVQSFRPEVPFSCRAGVCATCRARVVRGEVDTPRNWSLSAAEQDAGYVLTCQARPVSSQVTVDYDTL
jgi:ring-1,2-phenylacetyl-CoA epoxidase subunit PaaE